MNKFLVLFNAPDMSPAQYDQVISDLERSGAGAPKGRLHHVASVQSKGMIVADTFESEETLNAFAATLIPILVKNGVQPPQPQVLPVHNIIET